MIEVQEVFGPTIEGEGALVGSPVVYIRTGPARQPKLLSVEDLIEDTEARCSTVPYLITITGGEPCLYEEIGNLLEQFHRKNHPVKIETKGVRIPRWINHVDILSISPDLSAPSWEVLQASLEAKTQTTYLKAGILTEEDVERAHMLSQRFSTTPFYVFPKPDETLGRLEDINEDLLKRYRWLVDMVLLRQWTNVRVFPPAHVLLWGNTTGV